MLFVANRKIERVVDKLLLLCDKDLDRLQAAISAVAVDDKADLLDIVNYLVERK